MWAKVKHNRCASMESHEDNDLSFLLKFFIVKYQISPVSLLKFQFLLV